MINLRFPPKHCELYLAMSQIHFGPNSEKANFNVMKEKQWFSTWVGKMMVRNLDDRHPHRCGIASEGFIYSPHMSDIPFCSSPLGETHHR